MARSSSISQNFSDCFTVGEAADFLGVSRATLRNWDRSGKLKPRRHPQNGYRIYLHEDLEAVLRSAQLSTDAEAPFAPKLDWSDMGESDHFVQYYENDEFLIDSVSGYVSAALSKDAGSIAIATADHREAIERKLTAVGIDVAAAMERGRYVPLDAAETLSKFMVDGMPERKLFIESVGQVVA